MPDFVNATITFGVALSVKDKDKLRPSELQENIRKLIFDETEWLGDPQSSNGCVVSMKPKSFNVGTLSVDDREPPAEPPGLEDVQTHPTIIVKGARKGQSGKLMKKAEDIAEALKDQYTFLVIKTNSGGIKTVSIRSIPGLFVGYYDDKKNLVTVQIKEFDII